MNEKRLLFRYSPYWGKCKWNESGFRPPLCTYRLNWARRTSWGWRDDWDDTVLQTQDSKFGPWRSEAEYATSRSRRLPTILTFTHGWGRNNFVSFKPPRPGTEPRTLAWKAAVLTTTLGPPPWGRCETPYFHCLAVFDVWFWRQKSSNEKRKKCQDSRNSHIPTVYNAYSQISGHFCHYFYPIFAGISVNSQPIFT